MTRHIIDSPRPRRTASLLARFARLDRLRLRGEAHPVLARNARTRGIVPMLARFLRLERSGDGEV